MDNLKLIDLTWILSTVIIVQFGVNLIIERFKSRLEDKRNNVIFALYINKVYAGRHPLKECKNILNNAHFNTRKSGWYNKKTKEYYIETN